MALESATTINQLREEFPTGLDPKNQGDDHLRLIKGALKRTFPNVAGVVNASHEQLNGLLSPGVLNMPGMVIMWGYDVTTVPAGWKICNGVGTLRDGRAVPDLRNRFMVAATGTYAPGAVGGAATHTHAITVANHTLTVDQIPAHSHSVPIQVYAWRGPYQDSAEMTPGGNTQSGRTGGGQPHNHGGSAAVADSLPPYYSIIYIIKD